MRIIQKLKWWIAVFAVLVGVGLANVAGVRAAGESSLTFGPTSQRISLKEKKAKILALIIIIINIMHLF